MALGHSSQESRDTAREARRFVAAKKSGGQHQEDDYELPALEAKEWRERTYSSADMSSSEVEESPKSMSSRHSAGQLFKFDSPDSIEDAMVARRMRRKRKREKALNDEISWNEGLAHFVARRNAWSCAQNTDAKPTTTVGAIRPRKEAVDVKDPISISPHSDGSSSPTSSTSAASPSKSFPSRQSTPANPRNPPLTAVLTDEVRIPLAPPLIPSSNLIRARVKPSLYPEIYSKIIVQSKAPSIPLNLADVTRALVQGWKDDGEWPPKEKPLEPLAGSRKNAKGNHMHLKKGVAAVTRVLRLTGSISARDNERIAHGKGEF
ncbi:hypothetical protein LTR66_000573 [Elasticomyces elasticus]|nr:hypothetical protein LTR66_000573 [Elasticomyces elasticus]